MQGLLENSIYKKYRELILMAMDIFLVVLSLCLSVFLKFDFQFSSFRSIGLRIISRYVLLVLAVYISAFLAFQVHKSLWSYIGIQELLSIAYAVICATIVLVAGVIAANMDVRFASISITMGLLSLSLMLNVRVFYRILKDRSGRREKANSLIVGAGDGGYLMLKELEKNTRHNAYIVGFADDRKAGNIISGKRVLGKIREIPDLVRRYHVTKIFIAIPSLNQSELRRIIDICQTTGAEIKLLQMGDSIVVDPNANAIYPIKPLSINDLLGRGEANLDVGQISSYITGKAVLVTGAGGSIGSVLVKQILRFKPSKVVLLDFYENNMYELEQELKMSKAHGYIDQGVQIISEVASIREASELNALFQAHQPNVVFHAAAHKHVPLMEHSPREAVKNNIFGTRNVIDASLLCGAERFILISTDKAVKAANVMGATKRIAEMIMQSYAKQYPEMRMAAVRFGNVLGSSGSVVPLFEKQIADGGPVTLTHKDVERYFMTIPEAAQLVMQAGSFAGQGEIFVLEMGEPVRILELAEKMIRLSGYEPYKDIDIVEIGLRPGEKLSEELAFSEEQLEDTPNPSIYKAHPLDILESQFERNLSILECLCKTTESEDCLRESVFLIARGEPLEMQADVISAVGSNTL